MLTGPIQYTVWYCLLASAVKKVFTSQDVSLKMSRCLKVMLDAGADLSLKSKKNRNSYSIFYLGLLFYSFAGNAMIREKHTLSPSGKLSSIWYSQNSNLSARKNFSKFLMAKSVILCTFLQSSVVMVSFWNQLISLKKAILMLKHGADISILDFDGCNTLHTVPDEADFLNQARTGF